jgi:hypothetical protein
LSERPLPSPSENLTDIPSHSIIGAEFEIDIKGKYTAPDGKPVRSFDGSLYTFNGIDLASDYAYSASIASRVGLLLHVMRLRDFITASGKSLKVLRMDNEFLTIAIRSWCAQNHIKFLPSLPHRHNKTRRIERFHRSTSDLMMKQLAHKSHLTPQYWSLSWQHAVDMRNILPRKRFNGMTPYEKWFGLPYDLLKHPTVPFGSVVMSHIPLDQQTALSGRSIEGIAIGPSFEHDFGLRIFNPLTKRESIRHSYRNFGEQEPISTTYVFDEAHNLLSFVEYKQK